jgi:tripartite-type tricarboxylate transporter receptor subunit TctC
MKLDRRSSLKVVGGAAAATMLAAVPGASFAQDYPNQDIRLICSFPAGSGADVLVRYFAEKLRPVAGRTVIVENKVGAGGHIATEYVAKAKPDGYTIYVFAATGVALMEGIYNKPPVDVAKAYQIAAGINRQPFMLVVDVNSPYKTLADLIPAVKAKGDKATYATAAPPGTIVGEIFKQKTGIKAVEVNYRTSSDSYNEIASGKLDYAIHDPVSSLAQQRAGKFRLLAVSTGERLQASHDIPTFKEQGIDLDVTIWWAAMVPSATPRPVVDQINKWFSQIVATDETKKFLNSFGGDPNVLTPDQAQKLFLKAIGDWKGFVEIAKLPKI